MLFKEKKHNIIKKPEIIYQPQKAPREARFKIKGSWFKTTFYVLIGISIFYFVLFSKYFLITDVQIEGVKSVEINDYIQRTLINKNILLLQTGKYLNLLSKNYPILDEAKLIRGLPNKVLVLASERKQVMVWCNSTACFDIDNYGYAYEEVKKPEEKVALVDESNLPIQIGDQVASDKFIGFFLKTIDELEKINLKIVDARIQETTFKISFKTQEGFSVIMDSSESLKNQISALRQAVENNRPDIKEYIDVRVEGVVYVK